MTLSHAASSYSANRYDIQSAMVSTEQLARRFDRLVKPADDRYLQGVSMGGHVIGGLLERQRVASDGSGTFDAVAVAVDGQEANAQVFQVRDGVLSDRQSFYLDNQGEQEPAIVAEEFLLQYYTSALAIPSLIVEVDNVKASHGGTVGELDPEQIFYMMTRGISRAEAVRVLVEGYFEEVIMRLDDPGLEDLVRRRISEKLAGAEEQVREFIGERAEAT